MQKIEINEHFEKALKLLNETNKSLFITGKAGTGKSTLLDYFRTNTKKQVAVLAPTGVAALNVHGQTIHSFFKFPLHANPENVLEKKLSQKKQSLIQKLDTLIIDEASMLRADLLDCIDTVLRYYRGDFRPFGDLQIILFGDLYQLPPVVASAEERHMFKTQYQSPYFFDAKVFAEEGFDLEILSLKKIYRQRDQEFIDLLNKVRGNRISSQDLLLLNQRLNPHPDEDQDNFTITLTTTNAAAASINNRHLEKLNSDSWNFTADIQGEFSSKQSPTENELEVKKGAQVMLLNNDTGGRWVNGSMGKIIDIRFCEFEEDDVITVELSTGEKVDVARYKWEVFKYVYNEEKQMLETESIGSFTQYPLKLAWAVTIHKSQDKTFDNVIIDIGRGAFAHGQVYVALSRCTNLEGITLKKPIQAHHIIMDRRINNFARRYLAKRQQRPLQEEPEYDDLPSLTSEPEIIKIQSAP